MLEATGALVERSNVYGQGTLVNSRRLGER